MQPCVCAALLCVLLPAACGLKCFTCWGANPGSCDQVWDCPSQFDRCATTIVAESLVTKECMRSDMCNRVYSDGVRCCAEDLCNGGRHTGVFVPLLVASVAIFTLMI
ncbi:unnamed protein product [Tetraodon nigroviridis]|uniref:(spotted green pufferfish) hypothetical protein n=1 Tax=Tetraodon nigroviridis TaxID=99883 RepID=Q4RUW9_TETNG|nr:unnamed protein product [Tetraodon nigroviridis]